MGRPIVVRRAISGSSGCVDMITPSVMPKLWNVGTPVTFSKNSDEFELSMPRTALNEMLPSSILGLSLVRIGRGSTSQLGRCSRRREVMESGSKPDASAMEPPARSVGPAQHTRLKLWIRGIGLNEQSPAPYPSQAAIALML